MSIAAHLEHDLRLVVGAYVSKNGSLFRVVAPTTGDHIAWTHWMIENVISYGTDSHGEPMHETRNVSATILCREYELVREAPLERLVVAEVGNYEHADTLDDAQRYG